MHKRFLNICICAIIIFDTLTTNQSCDDGIIFAKKWNKFCGITHDLCEKSVYHVRKYLRRSPIWIRNFHSVPRFVLMNNKVATFAAYILKTWFHGIFKLKLF